MNLIEYPGKEKILLSMHLQLESREGNAVRCGWKAKVYIKIPLHGHGQIRGPQTKCRVEISPERVRKNPSAVCAINSIRPDSVFFKEVCDKNIETWYFKKYGPVPKNIRAWLRNALQVALQTLTIMARGRKIRSRVICAKSSLADSNCGTYIWNNYYQHTYSHFHLIKVKRS